jgi:hypothetical protein
MRIPGRWIAVSCHAALVGGLLAVLVGTEMAHDGQPDANIGGGMAALGLMGLGLPWSLIADAPALRHGSRAVLLLAVVGPAVLNVGIGALLAARRGRRLSSRYR